MAKEPTKTVSVVTPLTLYNDFTHACQRADTDASKQIRKMMTQWLKNTPHSRKRQRGKQEGINPDASQTHQTAE